VLPSRKKKRRHCRRQRLLLAEGLAVGALVHCGVLLVGTHQDSLQRAVVGVVAVVSAGLDGAFDALVGIAVHGHFLLFFGFGFSMTQTAIFMKNIFQFVFC
jgi:hypothetical protein